MKTVSVSKHCTLYIHITCVACHLLMHICILPMWHINNSCATKRVHHRSNR